MIRRLSNVLLAIVMVLTLNGIVCCGPSLCSSNSSCHMQDTCCECCCFKSADNLSAIASANPNSNDPAFTVETTIIPAISIVKLSEHKTRETFTNDPQLISKLNECKLFKMFVSRKDFV